MIKRPEPSSSSGSSLPPPSSDTNANDLDAASPDHRNGKDKKYARHGAPSEIVRRWMARHGKGTVVCLVGMMLSVFLIPPVKVALGLSSRRTKTKNNAGTVRAGRRAASSGATEVTAAKNQPTLVEVPPCPSAPWKEKEDLRGKCPGDLKPYKEATTMDQCASTCCANGECVSWQFRQDVGCLQGGDIRLGMEKDGVSAWCSDHPPQRWKGQYLKPHGTTEGFNPTDLRKNACDKATWNPDEQVGQCFGLGDVRKDAGGSAEECMAACCKDETCGAWQWNRELGCFYGKGMHGCQGKGDPIAFEPFVGRRKRQASRTYTDKHNQPWQMTL